MRGRVPIRSSAQAAAVAIPTSRGRGIGMAPGRARKAPMVPNTAAAGRTSSVHMRDAPKATSNSSADMETPSPSRARTAVRTATIAYGMHTRAP
jgi:hypothetical protein